MFLHVSDLVLNILKVSILAALGREVLLPDICQARRLLPPEQELARIEVVLRGQRTIVVESATNLVNLQWVRTTHCSANNQNGIGDQCSEKKRDDWLLRDNLSEESHLVKIPLTDFGIVTYFAVEQ